MHEAGQVLPHEGLGLPAESLLHRRRGELDPPVGAEQDDHVTRVVGEHAVAVVGLGLRRDVGVGADDGAGVDAVDAADRLDVDHDPADRAVRPGHPHDDVADGAVLAQRHRHRVGVARERRAVAMHDPPAGVERGPAEELVHREAEDAWGGRVRRHDRAVGVLDDDALAQRGEGGAVERLTLLHRGRAGARTGQLVLPCAGHDHPLSGLTLGTRPSGIHRARRRRRERCADQGLASSWRAATMRWTWLVPS